MNETINSNALQQEIRRRSIIVPFNFSGGTLDVSFLNSKEGNRVFADSYGPFSPEDYFAPDTYRILFVLKETYLGSAQEEKNLNEGHDKARENKDAEWSDLEPTYQNVAKMAFSLMEDTCYVDSVKNREAALSYMKRHVCIVNANIFPCVGGTESCDKRIYSWAQINKASIHDQYELYKPDIVIGGHTLSHFVTDVLNGKSCKVFGEPVSILGYRAIENMFGLKPGKNNDTYYNGKILMVNTKHPSVQDSSSLILSIKHWWEVNK